LCIASFGRALYVIDDIRSLRKAATNNGAVFNKPLMVFEAPISYQAEYKAAPGYEWSTWGLYEGENRNRGAEYSFFISPKIIGAKTDTATKSNNDSATVKIYNQANELIRTLKVKADSGFNRNYWRFETKGVRQPGSPKPKANSPEPVNFGMSAFPGTYKLVINFNKESDSTMVIVKSDPKIPENKEVYDAKVNLLKRLEKSTNRLTEVTDRLIEAEETIAKIEAQLKNTEGKEADSLRKTGKTMTDSIKNIRNFIMGKPLEKQGYGRPYQVTANGRLQDARGEIINKNKVPDAQEIGLVEMVETLTAQAVEKTNAFFNTKWTDYKKQAEATPLKIFKEYKPVE
jgi:hypothetical protein